MSGTTIFLRREVVSVAVVLPIGDAVDFVRDPKKLQGQVADMLQGGGVDPRTGRRQPSVLDAEEASVRPQLAAGKPARKSYYKSKGAGPVGAMTNCPECGIPLKVRGLKIHMAAKHKDVAPPDGDEPGNGKNREALLDEASAILDGEPGAESDTDPA